MPDRPPNFICVICHDLGQHLGCYGAADVRTPHLDAFAARGLRFARSFCTAPQCSPSRAALWTGRYAHANGVVGLAHGDFLNDLHPGERHFAQMLNDAGYHTHLFGNQHVSPDAGRCGFRHIHGAGTCGEIAADAVAFLEEREPTDPPFFMQVAFFEPHRPFPHADVESLDPATLTVLPYMPDIPVVREDLADLEASIASADRAFGAIAETIDRCGLTDDTIVVLRPITEFPSRAPRCPSTTRASRPRSSCIYRASPAAGSTTR